MQGTNGRGPEGRRVGATYRLQLSPQFTFADAAAQVPYLADLGVTHLYLSPVLEAVAGSKHGYDVTDPTTVRAALGGRKGLERLADTAHVDGLGLVIDIVPNHVGVGRPEQNPWWWDVLRRGKDSPYTRYFDLDFSPVNGVGGKIALPVLASGDDGAALTVDRSGPEPLLRYHDRVFPIGRDVGGPDAERLHYAQHYRLIPWDKPVRTYRRFLTVDELAAVRVEDPEVFTATHAEIGSWFTDGIADGLRIDHLDGLADPEQYLRRLRELVGPDAWIVVERAAGTDESLDRGLPIAGTTGYDALRELGHALLDPTGLPVLSALHTRVTGVDGAYTWGDAAAREVADGLAATDLLPETKRLARASGEQARVLAAQLDVALQAKTIEDTLAYRSARLISLNEVGGAPPEDGPSDPHPAPARRALLWPAAMTALSTHDTKRGEDVRARIGVLSQCAERWSTAVERWLGLLPVPPDPAMGLFLLQTAFGVWPESGEVTVGLRERVHAYATKAMREAHDGTSWTSPDGAFEAAGHAFLDALWDGAATAEFAAFVAELAPHGRSDALAQKLLQLAGPGVPDVYQGTERWEDSLVDPDNRRPVDWSTLATGGHPKQDLVRAVLTLRRERPDSFVDGAYAPLEASGPAAAHLLAFARGPRRAAPEVIALATRRSAALEETGGWRDTAVALPSGSWKDRLTGHVVAGRTPLSTLFLEHPVALLAR